MSPAMDIVAANHALKDETKTGLSALNAQVVKRILEEAPCLPRRNTPLVDSSWVLVDSSTPPGLKKQQRLYTILADSTSQLLGLGLNRDRALPVKEPRCVGFILFRCWEEVLCGYLRRGHPLLPS
jgi:hypothetical protein